MNLTYFSGFLFYIFVKSQNEFHDSIGKLAEFPYCLDCNDPDVLFKVFIAFLPPSENLTSACASICQSADCVESLVPTCTSNFKDDFAIFLWNSTNNTTAPVIAELKGSLSYNLYFSNSSQSNQRVLLGPILRHLSPVIQIPAIHHQSIVRVRTFVDPGWGFHYVVYGKKLSEFNVLSLKFNQTCYGDYDDYAFHTVQARTLRMDTNMSIAEFNIHESYKKNKDELEEYKIRFQKHMGVGLCLYPNENSKVGTPVGNAIFEMDHGDVAIVVGGVMILMMGLPVLCVATIVCYAYKRRNGIRQLMRLQLFEQQDEMRSQLLHQLNLPQDSIPITRSTPAFER
eukprot:GHVL01009027.1.p1 GENE.GHVL01009027.1~~GHVL01009027.1.p1  ORF type:complete len:341 (+),score=40.77 GHVL01009027.1:312-1334(+)